MKKIIITNGSGTCGKDTFAEILSKYVTVVKYSSIDFFKSLGKLGLMSEEKGEKERLLLHRLKKAFIEYNDLPLYLCSQRIDKFLQTEYSDLLVIDIREPEEIEKIVKLYPEIRTVLMINNNVPVIESNASDSGVFEYIYDFIVDNSGTLEMLEESALTLLKELDFNIEREEK